MRQLEVIVMDAFEARLAAAAGADRLELVCAIERGGLTPDIGTARQVVAAVDIPVHVMLRPHDRGFRYGRHERTGLKAIALLLRAAGAAGIVFGALDDAGSVDLACLTEIAAIAGLPLTFHRAFDAARDPDAAYAALDAVPAVSRVLTSGQAPDAWAGREVIRRLIAGGRRPTVLVGGGVTVDNLLPLVRATGAHEVHVGSAARSAGAIDAVKIAHLRTLLAQA